MKIFKRIAYILLIVIVLILGFVIYSISASDTNQDIKEKVKSEIEYFESKIIYMFNSLNNIEFQNYKLSVEDISEKTKKSSENSSSAGNGDDTSGGSSSSESGGDSSGSGKEKSPENNGQNSADKTQKFSLNAKGVLNSEKEINWDYIKHEAEIVQNSISTFSLDLYKIGLNNDDISNFSKEYDNLLLALKSEDKEESLRELVLVYSYFPKFIKNIDVDLQTEVVYSTKYSIFKAYSLIDSEKWDEIGGYLKEANNKFTKILTDSNDQNKNQYIISKCYILLNELQNSANLQDKQLFLIKYRNLLEDLNNM